MDSVTAKILIAIAALLLLGNTAAVAYLLASPKSLPAEPGTPVFLTQPAASPAAELTKLQASVDDLAARLSALENKQAPPTSRPTAATVKETLLYLGTGSTTSREWTNIESAAVTVDTAQYGTIQEVRFEAALSIISGEVYARLADKTSGAVYYDSQVSHNKSSSEWKTSSPIKLAAGKHTYVVQLRSSNGERANLDGARLKIMVK